ncbi:MAG: HD domain-containing protein [Planctomycetes bacterium]|nr:HD domain-containing protein [Planctomycetota bacterium]
MALERTLLTRLIRDAVAHKRVVKWGYVRQLGGLYPSECDSIAAHSNSVAVLASLIAHQLGSEIESECGVVISAHDVILMATFHDYGEGRSGDTGASSYAIRGTCNLHSLEREGLQASLEGLKASKKIVGLFDDYRAYRTAESLIVHIADNLEGFEKALHAARGSREILDDVTRIFCENLKMYGNRNELDERLGLVANYLVNNVLIPGNQLTADAYGLDLDIAALAHASLGALANQ